MKYYKIKITSPIQVELEQSEPNETEKKILKQLGLDSNTQATDIDKAFLELKAKRNKYLVYNSKDGFHLKSEIIANIFSEKDIKEDKYLSDYLKDKQYELIETDDIHQIMRYRRE